MVQPALAFVASPTGEFSGSRQVIGGLVAQQISLAPTTYQTSRLIWSGVSRQEKVSGIERLFLRGMGAICPPVPALSECEMPAAVAWREFGGKPADLSPVRHAPGKSEI